MIGQGVSAFMDYNAKIKTGGMQARMETAAAKSKAQLIRTRAREVKSAATAAYAGSGVDVSEGTPVQVQRQIAYESEHDALMELLNGKRRAQAAKAGAQLSADASTLSTGADMLSGWLRSRGTSFGSTGTSSGYTGSMSGAVE